MLDGLLFFPVTPFTLMGEVDVDALSLHVQRGIEHGAGGIFAGCGTGEFHALAGDEVADVARKTVEIAAGRVPVFLGAGGSLPAAIAGAVRCAEAGADGLLLMPPYLVSGPQAGLVAYVRRIAESVDIPVVVYQRGQAVFTPESVAEMATIGNVVGFKDGHGDIELMQRIVLAVRARIGDEPFAFFNGLPTAELSQRAYRAIGVSLYSSAVFAFAPRIAVAFHRAQATGDDATAAALLTGFFAPFAALRDRSPGYAIALVKAGVGASGIPVGGVRPPLVSPTPAEVAELVSLVEHGHALVDR